MRINLTNELTKNINTVLEYEGEQAALTWARGFVLAYRTMGIYIQAIAGHDADGHHILKRIVDEDLDVIWDRNSLNID